MSIKCFLDVMDRSVAGAGPRSSADGGVRTAGFRTSHGAADVLAAGIACFVLWPMIHGPRKKEGPRSLEKGRIFLEKKTRV